MRLDVGHMPALSPVKPDRVIGYRTLPDYSGFLARLFGSIGAYNCHLRQGAN